MPRMGRAKMVVVQQCSRLSLGRLLSIPFLMYSRARQILKIHEDATGPAARFFRRGEGGNG